MLQGFDNFLRPKSIAALQQAAVSGPIIILTASGSTCTALIVTLSDGVQYVPLPEMILPLADLRVDLPRALSNPAFDIHQFLANSPRGKDSEDRSVLEARLFGGREGRVNMSPNDVFRSLLADLWITIVKPVFDALNLKKSANPPRLWWCPTGPFAFLPIHAAGIYREDGTDCVSDYVVSSYTPTVTALLDPPNHTAASFKITAVIQPDAPNCSPLPGSQAELEKITKRVPKQWLTSLGDTTQATVESALLNLQQSSIVHFACHGIQDLTNPLDSGLVLSDGRLKVSEIMRKPENNISVAEGSMSLAFLSACETAKGDDKVPDEAMHLAATLLFAGFRGVVATMWTMADQDGPKIADIFYEHLFRNCDATSNPPVIPDLTEAAHALHLAVAKLREEPDIPFMRWVPFVHYGL
ncbi:CHAT domain-containing protein [Mycena sp. CBHHK59/15]|nr:CHAT domain-containing protein [Mycena sp. CBHHK59/15]